jgi:competence ComEA-like helix-hairpin-helix protein
VAVVDETGKFLEQTTIFPTEPRKDIAGSEKKLYRLVQKHKIKAITIGNGTGSRETDAFVKDFVRKYQNGEALGAIPPEQKPTAETAPAAVVEPETPAPEQVSSLPVDAVPESSSGIGSNEVSASQSSPAETVASEPKRVALNEPSEISSLSNSRLEQSDTAAIVAQGDLGEISANAEQPETGAESRASGDTSVTTSIEGPATPAEAAATTAEENSKITEERHPIFSVIVNESGASVYSASESGRQEFPRLDLTVRGAISIARRLQDPLAELVKIHPKSIGVGQYQHDVDQKRLKQGLETTVESCVNRVGVDLNTASYELLRYCSGVNQKLAKSILDYRNQHGKFTNRMQLLQVPGFGEKTFEQAAGFLRIKGGDNPLDATAVHPESYPVVEKMAVSLGVNVGELVENSGAVESLELKAFADGKVGSYTLNDIKQELLKPGRDPRDKFVVPTFRDDVKEVSDLKVDMVLEGTVTNVTNFGAFVDIGVHQDGLVHVSELSNRFIQDPREAVHVGEIVKVKVIGVDVTMKRISLSIKALLPERKKVRTERRGSHQRHPQGARSARSVAAAGGSGVPGKPSALAPKSPSTAQDRSRDQHSPAKPNEVSRSPALKPEKTAPVKQAAKAAAQGKKAELPKKAESPAPNLSFEEKIRLLQQKFGGIR